MNINNSEIIYDPVVNGIYNGIKRGIQVTLDNQCYGSAVILIFAGIDAMANLNRPDIQDQVKYEDFVKWVEEYIKIDSKEQITGDEFYSARCAVLHSYGVESRKTTEGTARKIGYMVGGDAPLRYNPCIAKDFLLLDVLALANSFFRGLDKFLVDLFANANTQKKQIIEKRLNKLLGSVPYTIIKKWMRNRGELRETRFLDSAPLHQERKTYERN